MPDKQNSHKQPEDKKAHKRPARSIQVDSKKLGLLLGGSGLIGGSIMNQCKNDGKECEILAPNSKKVSIRQPQDIIDYFNKCRPDFVINAAIASIDSSAQLAFEVNYIGAVRLANLALQANIPYIHISSAATLPPGCDLLEEDELELSADLGHYPKSKLLAEKTLKHLHHTKGLDYTSIRLAVVYGKHDHKIQGFHRLLFNVVTRKFPLMLTSRGVFHSYSNSEKLPLFIKHALENRDEFSGQTYHFVDPEPVEMVMIIQRIKTALGANLPRKIFIPYSLAKFGSYLIAKTINTFSQIGIESRMPGELQFLKDFYRSQTLNCDKLRNSSFDDINPDETVFSELPFLLEYYITRWAQFNLLTPYEKLSAPENRIKHYMDCPAVLLFVESPEDLLAAVNREKFRIF